MSSEREEEEKNLDVRASFFSHSFFLSSFFPTFFSLRNVPPAREEALPDGVGALLCCWRKQQRRQQASDGIRRSTKARGADADQKAATVVGVVGA